MFQCDICLKTFEIKDNMLRHKCSAHLDIDPDEYAMSDVSAKEDIYGPIDDNMSSHSDDDDDTSFTSEESLVVDPWSNIVDEVFQKCHSQYDSKLEKELQAKVRAIQQSDPARKPNIIVLGPVGAGKSSFINSVISVCSGEVSKETDARSCEGSFTREYIKVAVPHEYIQFLMYDTFGVAEADGKGFNVNDVLNVIQGHVKPGYVFKEHEEIKPGDEFYIARPREEDRIHCVVFVLDASKLSTPKKMYSDKYVKKLQELQSKVQKENGFPFVVVLSHCDVLCEDIKETFKNGKVNDAVEKGREIFKVQKNDVFPLKNYESEGQIDPIVNIHILLALKQILHRAYRYQNKVAIVDRNVQHPIQETHE